MRSDQDMADTIPPRSPSPAMSATKPLPRRSISSAPSASKSLDRDQIQDPPTHHLGYSHNDPHQQQHSPTYPRRSPGSSHSALESYRDPYRGGEEQRPNFASGPLHEHSARWHHQPPPPEGHHADLRGERYHASRYAVSSVRSCCKSCFFVCSPPMLCYSGGGVD